MSINPEGLPKSRLRSSLHDSATKMEDKAAQIPAIRNAIMMNRRKTSGGAECFDRCEGKSVVKPTACEWA